MKSGGVVILVTKIRNSGSVYNFYIYIYILCCRFFIFPKLQLSKKNNLQFKDFLYTILQRQQKPPTLLLDLCLPTGVLGWMYKS